MFTVKHCYDYTTTFLKIQYDPKSVDPIRLHIVYLSIQKQGKCNLGKLANYLTILNAANSSNKQASKNSKCNIPVLSCCCYIVMDCSVAVFQHATREYCCSRVKHVF